MKLIYKSNINSYGIILLVCFLLAISSLSYLSADTFMIDLFLVMYLLYYSSKHDVERKNNKYE